MFVPTFILFFILFFAAVTVSAQEFGTKFKPIPAPKFSTKKKTPIPQVKDPQAQTADMPSIKTPNVFDGCGKRYGLFGRFFKTLQFI